MPTIEEVDDFSDPDDAPLDAAPLPPPTKPQPQAPRAHPSIPVSGTNHAGFQTVEPDAVKNWIVVYPIYLDAKRPYRAGARRVPNSIALQWPLALGIAQACKALQISSVYEPNKTHPKDWANPGRVRVLLEDNGQLLNPRIKDKRALMKQICALMRPHQPVARAPTVENPHPLPPIEKRLPHYSPAVSMGMLEGALNGDGPMGGMGDMLGNMLGVPAGGGEEEEEVPVDKKKVPPMVQKQRKIRMKKR